MSMKFVYLSVDSMRNPYYTLFCEQQKLTEKTIRIRPPTSRVLSVFCLWFVGKFLYGCNGESNSIISKQEDLSTLVVLKGGEKMTEISKEARDKVLWYLQKHNLTQSWLMNMLREKKGLDVCKTVLSYSLRGERKNDTASEIISESLDILESYERWYDGYV